MLRKIRVRGFKSLEDVEAELAPLVVVFGPNAVGKSNLLESIELLSRLVRSRTIAEAFDTPRGYPTESFTLPTTGLPGLLEQELAELTLEGIVAPEQGDSLLYRVTVGSKPSLGSLELADEYLTRLNKSGEPKARFEPRLERTDDELLIRRIGEQGRPRKEHRGLNHVLASNLQFSGDKYPDFDRLRDELGGWRVFYLDPRTAMRSAQPPRQVDEIGAQGQWLAPFLYRLKKSAQHQPRFRAIGRALRAAIPSIENLDVDLDPQRGTLDIEIVQSGTPFSSRVVSEGTLRVLALCAISANPWPGSLIAFEEPENGVHPRRIETIVELLVNLVANGRRQLVVTTHSPLVVSAMARHQREQPDRIRLLRCSQSGSRTRVDPFDALPLFEDREIAQSLDDGDDGDVLVRLLRRGWLGG
ncbi:MAG: ATP-binding protein [Nannocystaceae bacterium]